MTTFAPVPTMAEPMPNAGPSEPGVLSPELAMTASSPKRATPAGGTLDPTLTKGDPSPIVGPSGSGEFVTAAPAKHVPTSNVAARVRLYDDMNGALLCLAETLDDIEKARLATGGRIDAIERRAEDFWPYSFSRRVDDPETIKGRKSEADLKRLGSDRPGLGTTYIAYYGLCDAERLVTRKLQSAMRKHPLGDWAAHADRRGIGDKQLARLLASIGNPYWNLRYDRPRRGPAELWAYCGYSVKEGRAVHREAGEHSNWVRQAKARSYLIALSCVRQTGAPYEVLYREAKAYEEGRTHSENCSQCGDCGTCGKALGRGPKEHAAETGCTDRKVRHAQPGDPLKPGHQDMRAVRKVAKAVLRDIFVEAKRWHEEEE